MFIDEEVYNALSGDLVQTIGQSPICNGDSKQWLLRPSRYRVYGMTDSMMVTSTKLVISHQSSTGTIQFIFATKMKVEHTKELITILSNDLDGNSPILVLPITFPLVNCFFSRFESEISYSVKSPGAPRGSSDVSQNCRFLEEDLGFKRSQEGLQNS